MDQSMRKYMRVGIILHVAYRGLAGGEGPILECLEKVVQDEYFEAVEVAKMNDPDVRRKAAALICQAHMDAAYGGQAEPCLQV